MNPERWRRVKAVFAAAVEADPARRAPLLDQLCAGDHALRSEVFSLIAAHESATGSAWFALRAAPAPEPEPEFQGTARFAVEARLGAGGFGVVYRAHDREAGRAVALKVLRDRDAAALIRFKREFRVLADVLHPNLVRLHELFAAGDRVFFTMELVEGRPLVEALRARAGAAPPEAAVARVFRQLAQGVAGLHGAGLLHRDLKPSNVLLTDDGRVVILDFGLAADAHAANTNAGDARGPVCGTPAYMAPEQFVGRAAEASDWYGVGTMLFEALAGRLPYAGELLALVEHKSAGAPALPAPLAAAYPALAPLAVSLLAPEPEARPDGAAIARALATADDATPARAARPGRPAPRGSFVGREAQLDVLRRAWARARGGELAVVCVRGASGMGKTALVRRFLDELGDVTLLAGRCHEREALGYKALDGVVDGLGQLMKALPPREAAGLLPEGIDDLARLFPVLRVGPGTGRGTPGQPRAVERPSGTRTSAPRDSARLSGTESTGPLRDNDQRRRAFDALRELLGGVARRGPSVVFIDDLQWGDDDSAALLRHVLRPPAAPPLLVIAACRQDERVAPAFAALLESLRASGRVEEVAVGALSDDEARALAARLLGPDHAAVAAVAQEAGGVPFFVDTLVERLWDADAGAVAPGVAARADEAAGHELRLHHVLRERIAELPGEARRLLEVVALAGKPLGRRVARQAAGLAGADEAGAEQLLRARRLLRLGTDGASLEAYHDRIRDTATGALQATALPGLHWRIAQALTDAGGADPEDLAQHLAAAGERRAAAARAVEAAEQRFEALAFDRAAALYRMAIDLEGPDHPDVADRTQRMADALAAAGRGEKAGDAYLAAAARASGSRDLTFKGAVQYLRAGHLERGRALMTKVLRTLGWRVPRTTVGVVLAVVVRRAQLALRGLRVPATWTPREGTATNLLRMDACWTLASSALMADMARATYFQTHNLLTALREGEPIRLARALGLEAIQTSLPGARSTARTDRTVRLLRQISDSVGDPVMDGLAPLAEGVVAANRGEWRKARQHSLAATEILAPQGAGLAWEVATARFFLLGALVSLGEFREFSERFPAFHEDSRARGDLYAEAILVLSSGSYIVTLKQDRVAEANAAVDDALSRLPARGYQVPKAWAHFAKVDIALYAGDVHEAWRLEGDAWPSIKRSLLVFFQTLRIYLRHQYGRAALALASRTPRGPARDRLVRSAAAEARALERERLPWATGFALGLRAGVAFARGDADGAAAGLAAAARQLEEAEMGMHAAATRLVWGRLVGGEEGRLAVARAEAWMRAQGVERPERVARTVCPGYDRD